MRYGALRCRLAASCLILIAGASLLRADDSRDDAASEIDQRLLDGLDSTRPEIKRPANDDAGEDLGAAKPESTLSTLATLMQNVEQRIQRRDTSTATQQLQKDIADQLEKMLQDAAQQNESQASASNQSSGSASQASTETTGGEPSDRGDAEDPHTELIGAVWGSLPERLRQQIQSPLQEEFLPRYERIIKQYYKRLVEQQRQLKN